MTTSAVKPLPRLAVADFRSQVAGAVLVAGDPGYDDRRRVWNGMIDRFPAVIVQPVAAGDWAAAILFARKHEMLVAVRGGGHNVSGSAVVDAGLVIDHGARRQVRLSAGGDRVFAEPGVRLGDLDAATSPASRTVPIGINTTTGVAGLALGGGIGWRTRSLGLTCDHLVGAHVVLADGTALDVDERAQPDLLWALRGGGGNFGIVTRFHFRAVAADPAVQAGFVWYPLEEGAAVLRHYRDWATQLPRDVTSIVALKTVVDVMPGPPELKGRQIVAVGMCAPNNRLGSDAARDARGFGTVLFDAIRAKPFVEHQAALDVTVPAGLDYYWKSHYLSKLDDALIDLLVEHHLARPTAWSYSLIAQLGGAMTDVPEDATAFASRSAGFTLNINGVGLESAHRPLIVDWVRRCFDAVAPHGTGGVYVNFMGEEGAARVHAAYGAAYERLAELKRRYDPDNFFQVNQNIVPASSDASTRSRPSPTASA